MSTGPENERSMLEAKELDQLQAIAKTLSVKANSRTKKADLVTRILEATGVSEGASPKPEAAPKAEAAPQPAQKPAERENRAPEGSAEQAPPREGGAPRGERTQPRRRKTVASFTFDPMDPGPGGSVGLDDDLPEPGELTKAPAVFPEPSETESSAPRPPRDNDRQDQRRGDRPQRQDRGQNGDRNQGGQGNRNQDRNQGGYGQSQPSNELGGRRNRRRRGKDRDDQSRGQEREFQANAEQYQGELIEIEGVVDLRDEGFGFIRTSGYLPSSRDIYVSISLARRHHLRRGDVVAGAYRPAAHNEKFAALMRIDKVHGLDPEVARLRPKFEDLTPLFPDSKLVLETGGERDKENLTARIVDLLAPIGKGQRGLIVSPPKAGKTTVMKQIAHSIEKNNPDIHLMVLLVDERPEEVTDMKRSVAGEVIASTFDRPSEEHTAVAELALERAKRLVEMGRDVVIILDGITRLARAYNLASPATGRIMSGGVDSGALYPPKKFFGAARNIEEGGSLTILATALVETGSKMDEVIFEEFKGTGNMELRLDRRLAERRLYPSIDVNASSTRHEELLFDRGQLQQVWKLRRVLNALAAEGNSAPGLELLMDKIRTTSSNNEFLAEIAKGPTPNN